MPVIDEIYLDEPRIAVKIERQTPANFWPSREIALAIGEMIADNLDAIVLPNGAAIQQDFETADTFILFSASSEEWGRATVRNLEKSITLRRSRFNPDAVLAELTKKGWH
jgi:hypothetical protein